MNRDGTVRSAAIEESSGAQIFDQEALDTVRRAQPLPAIPAALADHLKILLPVEYSAP
jgi:protein TonB